MLAIQTLLDASKMTGEKHFSCCALNPVLLKSAQCSLNVSWSFCQAFSQGTCRHVLFYGHLSTLHRSMQPPHQFPGESLSPTIDDFLRFESLTWLNKVRPERNFRTSYFTLADENEKNRLRSTGNRRHLHHRWPCWCCGGRGVWWGVQPLPQAQYAQTPIGPVAPGHRWHL